MRRPPARERAKMRDMTAHKEYKTIRPVRVGFGPISLAHDEETVNGFLAQFQRESDKSIVISSAAIIEEVLEELLIFKSKRVDDNKLHERLFKYTGPLSSFASKIDVCYFLGYITSDFHNDLHIIRRLRNQAAHSWKTFSFEEDSVKARIANIKTWMPVQEGDISIYAPKTKLLLCCAAFMVIINAWHASDDKK
jgi:DNA-binding MltR family transcriptional regulator